MSRYDEDIYENPFFHALENQHKALFEKATTNRWVICIPKFSMVKKAELEIRDFEDHILVPSVDTDASFTTVSNHKVEIQQCQIILGSGFKIKKVDVLFEETFYNLKDQSYRVVCVSEFFNRENEPETCEGSDTDPDLTRPPETYEECIKMLWGHQGSAKTRENLDKLLKLFCGEYQRFEGTTASIPNLADLVSTHVTKAMQIVLKDQHMKNVVRQNDLYMASLKIAVETYMMNGVHKHLFSTITACVKSADAHVNKMTRNLADIRLHNLDVRREFEENLPSAKKELSRLNQYSTPLGRMFCVKRVVTSLTKPLFKSREHVGLVMTSDDLLPLLIYLIIKSQIPNWTANLMYMKYFQLAKVTESNEFSFYLATTEAALDYISSGNLKQTRSGGKESGFTRQTSGSTTSSKDKFFQYVQYGDESAVSLMLKRDKSTNDISSQLCHPLCSCEKCLAITASAQNLGAVSTLARDDMGRTALHIAAFHGHGTLIDILAKNGCLADATDYLGCTPLHLASQKGFQNIILLLVHFGADIGSIDNEGNTPLHLCAKNGHEDCVKAILFLDILKSILNVNARNDMGDTPLHMAARWGYDGIVNFLLESEADSRIRNRKGQTPYNVAQNADIKKELLNYMNYSPPIIVRHAEIPLNLPVCNAIDSTQPASIRTPTPTSVQATPENCTRLSHDKTPLGFEVLDIRPSRPEIQLIDNSSSEMMSPTTPAVASLDQADLRQIERLFKAIAINDLPLVQYYFGWLDSSSSEDSPMTPPTTPVLSDNIAAELCHPLCQCEKCKRIQKHSNMNMLHVNCQNRKGYAPLHTSVIENNMEVLTLLLKKGAYVNILTHKHITPLHLTCFHNQLEMVKKLVSCGANVNIPDLHGEIPLHLASAKSNLEITTFLLQHSSSVNLGNVNGNTSLHHAVCTESVDVIRVLLEYGAVPDVVNKHNRSPLDLTTNEVILKMLNDKAMEMNSRLAKVPKSISTPESLNEKQHNEEGNDKLRKISKLEQQHLQAVQQIGLGIRTFDKQRQLKRSQTFDHSTPAIDNASLRLALSIQHFDKGRSLKRAQTLDRSSAYLRPLEHSLSIQHFDSGTLKHVEPVDKSRPLHIYSLTRSFSSYCNYADTPTVEKSVDITKEPDSEVIEQINEETPNNGESKNQEKTMVNVIEETKDDNTITDGCKDQGKVNSHVMEETKEDDPKNDGSKDQGKVNFQAMEETKEVNPNDNRNVNQENAVTCIPEYSDDLTAKTTSVQSNIDNAGLFEDLESPKTSAIGEDWVSCDILKADCKEFGEVSERDEPGPQDEDNSEVTSRIGDYAINADTDVINIASEAKTLG